MLDIVESLNELCWVLVQFWNKRSHNCLQLKFSISHSLIRISSYGIVLTIVIICWRRQGVRKIIRTKHPGRMLSKIPILILSFSEKISQLWIPRPRRPRGCESISSQPWLERDSQLLGLRGWLGRKAQCMSCDLGFDVLATGSIITFRPF